MLVLLAVGFGLWDALGGMLGMVQLGGWGVVVT